MAYALQKEKVKIGISGSKFYFEPPPYPIVAPNDEELDFIRLRTQETCRTPLAIRIRKFRRFELAGIRNQIVDFEKQRFRNICTNYPKYEFLFYFQFPRGYRITINQAKNLEDMQKIDEAHFIISYESNTSQHFNIFNQQLEEFRDRNKDRIVVPLLDPGVKDTTNLAAKATAVVRQGCKVCGVISRHYLERGWNRIMPILKEAGVYVIVFGVNPRFTRRGEDDEYCLLVPPLLFGADVVSHGLPWSGGPSKLRFLKSDWIYHRDMSGDNRLNYELSKARAIFTSNQSCETDLSGKEPLTVAQIKEGFRYFASDMGLLDKRRIQTLNHFQSK